ncbi:MAG: hypothetical protein AAF433_06435 [Bacteroidota bacterium]
MRDPPPLPESSVAAAQSLVLTGAHFGPGSDLTIQAVVVNYTHPTD